MKITKITAQVKRAGRYSIFVDGKFVFGISETGLINSGLKTGQEVSLSELNQYKQNAEIDKLYNKTLELIMRRPRSQWEITDYLKRKNASSEQIAALMQILTEKGFNNDQDFAKKWVDNRRLLKNISQRKLRLELKQKRISEEIIDQVLAEDETDEIAVIKAEIAKKRRQTRYRDNQKLIAYLARQGYNYSDIKAAITD